MSTPKNTTGNTHTPLFRNRAMTVEKARELWGEGHEELSDQQFQDMIELFYAISIGLYENRLKS